MTLPEPGTVKAFGSSAHLVLARNPGWMTLDGTNTWILCAPSSKEVVVVDPGPADPLRLDAIHAAVRGLGATESTIVLTHGHVDHSEAAPSLAQQTGAGVLAMDARHAVGDELLHPGDELQLAGLTIDVMHTPGHSSDSISMLIRDEGSLLTGDTVLGRGTTVVAHPDGKLVDYLSSIEALRQVAGVQLVLPGHGPVIEDPKERLDYYLSHRLERLAQIREAIADGAKDAQAVVESVYDDVDPQLWPAATLSVLAQLDYLRDHEGLEC